MVEDREAEFYPDTSGPFERSAGACPSPVYWLTEDGAFKEGVTLDYEFQDAFFLGRFFWRQKIAINNRTLF